MGAQLPAGITNLYGHEGSFKTTLALWLCNVDRPTYWLAYEPLPERAHTSLVTSLESLQVAEPATVKDGADLIRSVPQRSLVVVDTLDSAAVTGGILLSTQWLAILAQAWDLIGRGVSVLLLSQIRYLGNGITGSGLSYVPQYLTVAAKLEVVRKESRFGERTWSHIRLQTKKHLLRPVGNALLYFHPELGFCPEMELLVALQERLGPSWRSLLKISLPHGREAAVREIRNQRLHHLLGGAGAKRS